MAKQQTGPSKTVGRQGIRRVRPFSGHCPTTKRASTSGRIWLEVNGTMRHGRRSRPMIGKWPEVVAYLCQAGHAQALRLIFINGKTLHVVNSWLPGDRRHGGVERVGNSTTSFETTKPIDGDPFAFLQRHPVTVILSVDRREFRAIDSILEDSP